MDSKAGLLLVLASVVTAGPLNFIRRQDGRQQHTDPFSCAAQCKGKPSQFDYVSDTSYHYDYSVHTSTSGPGGSEDKAQILIQARAEIEAVTDCEFALRLRDVRASNSDPFSGRLVAMDREDEIRQTLTRRTLRFSFDDGVIESVCPQPDEQLWALNFKRGLLSAFQSSMKAGLSTEQVTETDVSGKCETQYNRAETSGWNNDVIIHKSKQLTACSHRDGFRSILQATPYSLPSEIQSVPLLQSTHECEQHLNSERVLTSSKCQETHVLAPFSHQGSGARTSVTQALTFRGSQAGVTTVKELIRERRDLLFEHVINEGISKGNRESAEQKLKEICDQTHENIRPETPRLFSELVTIVRKLDKSDLETLVKKLKDNKLCPKNDRALHFLQDALPVAGTTGAVQLMLQLIRDGKLSETLQKGWLSSLAFIHSPTDAMVQEGLLLLKSSVALDSLLPVTSMVHNLCHKMADCQDHLGVSEIEDQLDRNIGSYCEKDNALTVRTLRAIGNLGHSEKLRATLDRCIRSSYAPLEVRLFATDAYRRMPCSEDEELWKILKNKESNPELAIAAYLALMRCPSQQTLDKMAGLLVEGLDEQVGSFIFSHLRNIGETSDPHKQEVAEAVRRLTLNKDFELTALKYSHNYEASFLLNKLNVGLTAESDLVMTSDSPVPRSARANLTVELFGNAVNLLEVGGRVEGLQHLPGRLLLGGILFDINGKKTEQEPVKGSFYGRVLGNEIFFLYNSLDSILEKSRKSPNVLEVLLKLSKTNNLSFTHSQHLMDISLVVPTAAGFPLNLTLNGSLSVDLQAKGKMDLRKISTRPRSLDIDGEIRPSAALEVSATMSVDALVTTAGIRMRNTLHSSTMVKGRIGLNKGRQLSVELDTPQDKMEIFSAKSQFFVLQNSVEKEQQVRENDRMDFKRCTGSKLAHVIGLELCGELHFPQSSLKEAGPFFPFAGPSSVSLVLHKRDTHTGYTLLAKTVQTRKSVNAQFQMNTPGSRVDRHISTDLTLNFQSEVNMHVSFVSPWKTVSLDGAFAANKKALSLSGNIVLDRERKYQYISEIALKDRKKTVTVLSPLIELRQPGLHWKLLSGQIDVDSRGQGIMDLEMRTIKGFPYNFKADLADLPKDKHISLSLSNAGKNEYSFETGTTIERSGKGDSFVRLQPMLEVKAHRKTLLSAQAKAEFRRGKTLKASLSLQAAGWKSAYISFDGKNTKRRKSQRLSTKMKLKTAAISGSMDTTTNIKTSVLTNKARVIYTTPRTRKNTVTLNTKINNRSKNQLKLLQISSHLNVANNPKYNTDVKASFSHKKRNMACSVDLRYDKNRKDANKKVLLQAAFENKSKNLRNIDIKWSALAQAPEKNIDLKMKASHSHTPKKVQSGVSLTLLPYVEKDVTASIMLQDKSSKWRRYSGHANVACLGKTYTLKSDLAQKSPKQYLHSIHLDEDGKQRHSATTVYKRLGPSRHEVNADIVLANRTPYHVSMRSNIDPKSALISGSVSHDKDTYSISSLSKYVPGKAAKLNLALAYPKREIKLDAVGSRNADKMLDGSFSLNWDAGNKNSKKSLIEVGALYQNSERKDVHTVTGQFNVKSPLKQLQDLGVSVKYANDPSQCIANGKLSWGGKRNKIFTDLAIQKPFSVSNAQASFKIQTPVTRYREIELSLDHRLEPNFFTQVKAGADKLKGEVLLTGQNNGDVANNDLNALLSVKTSFEQVRDVAINFTHRDDGKHFNTMASVRRNGEKYIADFSMDNEINHEEIDHTGKLSLSGPRASIDTKWGGRLINLKSVEAKVNSKWGKRKNLYLELKGSVNSTENTKMVKGDLMIRSPFKAMKHVKVSTQHILDHGGNRLISQTTVFQGRIRKAFHDIKLERLEKEINVEFGLLTPLHDHKIRGQASGRSKDFLTTSFGWLEWSPSSRVDLDASLDVPAWDRMTFNAKLLTPFSKLRNIVFKASNTKRNSEYVSKLNLDYGVRKAIDLEGRYRYDKDLKLLRARVITPFDQLRSLDTGVRLETPQSGIKGNADFELLPYVEKNEGSIYWNNRARELEATLKMSAPYKELRDVHVVTSSKRLSDGSRKSFLQVAVLEKTYKLNVDYRLHGPLKFSAVLRTPHPEFDDVGVLLSYDRLEKEVTSIVQVTYLPQKVIKTTIVGAWDYDIHGSVTVETPFEDFKKNSVSFLLGDHPGNFRVHAEAHVGPKDVVGDVYHTSSRRKTLAGIVLSTPVQGLEKIALIIDRDVMQRQNDKSSVSMTIGDKMKAETQALLQNDAFKWSASLESAVTKNFKVSLDLKSKRRENNIVLSHEGSIDASYGDKKVKFEAITTFLDITNTQVSLLLDTPYKPLSGKVIFLVERKRPDGFYLNCTIHSHIKKIGKIYFTVSKHGPLSNLKISAKVTKDGNKLVEISGLTTVEEEELHSSVTAQGELLPDLTVSLDHKGGLADFNNKAKVVSSSGLLFKNEITFSTRNLDLDIDCVLNYRLKSQEDKSASFNLHKEGKWNNWKLETTGRLGEKGLNSLIEFSAINKIKGVAVVKKEHDRAYMWGLELDHMGDINKFVTEVKVSMPEDRVMYSRVNFYRDGLEKIELYVEVGTPFEGFTLSTLDYKHEQGDNHLSCSLFLQAGQDVHGSADLRIESAPHYLLNFNVNTPVKGLEELGVSGDWSDNAFSANVKVGEGNDFSLAAVRDDIARPPVSQVNFQTPMSALQQVTLTVKGEPLDHTVDLLILLDMDERLEAKTEFKYDDPFSMKSSASLDSTYQFFNGMFVELVTARDDQGGQTANFSMGANSEDRLVVASQYRVEESTWETDPEQILHLTVILPFRCIFVRDSISLKTEHRIKPTKGENTLTFYIDEHKLSTVEMKYDFTDKLEVSMSCDDLCQMEMLLLYDDGSKEEGLLYLNWNRENKFSNIQIQISQTDNSRPGRMDKVRRLVMQFPTRTVGIEHTIRRDADQLQSTGKLFWDDDSRSHVTYVVDVSDSVRRGQKYRDGLFKLELPSRTLGLTSSFWENHATKSADVAFSWDMARDRSRQVGLQASLTELGYTKLDMSLRLPEDMQVDHKMTLNQENIIFDGKTDIFFSRDTSKTLTFFSTVKQMDIGKAGFLGYSRNKGFNYSLELGVSHPETKVDVTLDSHLGSSEQFATSSVGLKYLTSRQQRMNLALWLEIDKLKEEISLFAISPNKKLELQGQVVNRSPLQVDIRSSVDSEENVKASLQLDAKQKQISVELAKREESYKLQAGYSNSSALQASLLHSTPYLKHQTWSILGLRLMNPHLLRATLEWNNELLATAQSRAKVTLLHAKAEAKVTVQELLKEMETEVSDKYREITKFLQEETKPFRESFGFDLAFLERDLERVAVWLERMRENNVFHAKDFSLIASASYRHLRQLFSGVSDQVRKLSTAIRENYQQLRQAATVAFQELRDYPIKDLYRKVIVAKVTQLLESIDTGVTALIDRMDGLGSQVFSLNEKARTWLSNVEEQIKRKLDEHLTVLGNLEQLFQLPSTFYNKLVDVWNMVETNLSQLLPEALWEKAMTAANELYEQVSAVFHALQLKSRWERGTQTLLRVTHEILRQEFTEYMAFKFGFDNALTMADPLAGKVQMDLVLPLPIYRLDRVPDWRPYLSKVQAYAPSLETLNQYTPALWNITGAKTDRIQGELTDYKPSKAVRRYYKRRRQA